MNKTNLIFILIAVVVLAIVGFWYFQFGGVAEVKPLVVSRGLTGVATESTAPSTARGLDILGTLSRLQKIKIDTSFFENKNFKSLVGKPTILPQVGTGRLNPFAPISLGVSGGVSVEDEYINN